MIKIENVDVHGFEAAIRGMRNPMNSWDKSDSEWVGGGTLSENCVEDDGQLGFLVGRNDRDLMMRLAKAGTEHAKYQRMITVTADVVAPDYWFKEFSTYRVGVTENSTSTMHRIHAKEFEPDDFSFEYIKRFLAADTIPDILKNLNYLREVYINFEELKAAGEILDGVTKKDIWYCLIQLLPMSYNYRRTICLNYQVLANIYRQRKNHKLDEWRQFCEWIKTLPCSELITLEE